MGKATMGTESTTAEQLRLDERNHIEKPKLFESL